MTRKVQLAVTVELNTDDPFFSDYTVSDVRKELGYALQAMFNDGSVVHFEFIPELEKSE